MKEADDDILNLINSFLKDVAEIADIFYKKYDRKDLLRACHTGTIPRVGKLQGVSYSFHGIGLYAKNRKIEIDFDFGPDNRIDGFDSWRLWNYAMSRENTGHQWTQPEI